MKNNWKYLLYLTAFLLVGINAWAAWKAPLDMPEPDDRDTTVRFPVARIIPQNEEDLDKKSIDLKNPDDLKIDTVYDPKTNTYIIGKKLGDGYLSAPIIMTAEEYQKWSLQKSLQAYYRTKNQEEFNSQGKNKFDFTNMHFDLGPADKIFGPGGVQIKTQGSAELKIGANMRNVQNPALSVNKRKTFGFDFDQKINMSLKGSVGDKINMNLN